MFQDIYIIDCEKSLTMILKENFGNDKIFRFKNINPNDLDKRQTSGIDVNGFLDYEGINKVSGGGKLKIKEKGKYVN